MRAHSLHAGIFLSIMYSISLASAQSYVSNTGNDANDCSLPTRACASFNRAFGATGALFTGNVKVLTSGAYGNLTINRPASITAETEGVNILGSILTISAGASDEVFIKGLNFEGQIGQDSNVIFNSGLLLDISNSRFSNNRGNPTGFGVSFGPAGASHLAISNTYFVSNGVFSQNVGAGLLVKPSGAGTARVTLYAVHVEGNVFGVALDGTTSGNGINCTISESVLASNVNDGLLAATSSGGAPIGVMVKNTKSSNNGFGIRSIGSNVTVRVDGSTITGNSTGLSTLSGGALLTFGNNAVRANGNDGAFSGPVALQ